MTIKCIGNNLLALDKRLKFAFGQDRDGIVDLIIGKEYQVYGVRKNKYGEFYLVLTDIINTNLPWWMPAGLFKVVDKKLPSGWKSDLWEGNGGDEVKANPIYFEAEDDIEDGTKHGREIFEQMKKEVDEFNTKPGVK